MSDEDTGDEEEEEEEDDDDADNSQAKMDGWMDG